MSNEERLIRKAIDIINKYKHTNIMLASFEKDRYSIHIVISGVYPEISPIEFRFECSFPLYFIATGCDDKYDKEAKIPDTVQGENRTILRLAYIIWASGYSKAKAS